MPLFNIAQLRFFLKPITPLSQSVIEDLKLAASKMQGACRRAFLAEMALKYYRGSPGLTEIALGWGRDSIKLGLAEKRSGLVCIGGQSAWSGNKRWEEKHPDTAQALWLLAESHAQQDPTFKSTIAFTRLTSARAIKELRAQGYGAEQLPAPSSMAVILNRNGYRLRKVVKAKPQKKYLKPTPSSPT